MTEHPGFSLSVVLRYFVVPALVLGLLTLWFGLARRPWRLAPVRPERAVWMLIALFWVVYGVLGTLAYLGYRTTIQDLGIYDQRMWVLAIAPGFPGPERIVKTFAHFSPLLAVHVLLYEIYPSALVLVWTQVLVVGLGAYPLYRLAARHLGPGRGLAFAATYLLYPSVVFTVRFDFHPDHLLLPLLLFAFDALDRRSEWVLAAASAAMFMVKESLIPTVSAFGVYVVLIRRRWLLGTGLLAGGVAVFVFLLVQYYSGIFVSGASGRESYGYLGADPQAILRTFVLAPSTWLPELIEVPKLKFLFLMVAPLAFLPLFGPLALLVAVPGLLMSLLSHHPHRYQIWAQYTAPIVPPLMVAAVFGFRRLAAWRFLDRLLRGGSGRVLVVWLLGAGLYFNVLFSPSPLSLAFWLGTPERMRWAYHVSAYRLTERDREIRRALQRYVPSDPTVGVSAQNSLNSSHLAHRVTFEQFPTESDFVVVDLHRPLYVYDRIDPGEFMKAFAELKDRRTIVYEMDGFFIFGPPTESARPSG